MCKAIALTFSQKNRDIYEKIMNRDKSKYKNNTDYICEAIRAFQMKEDNNVTEFITKNDIELIINNALNNFKLDLMNSNVNLSSTNIEVQEDKKLELLEENLDSNILNTEED